MQYAKTRPMFRNMRNIGRVLSYCMLPKWLIIEYPLVPRSLRPRLFNTGSLSQNLRRPHVWLVKAKGKRFYPYTAIDEFSRWRYMEAFEECSTCSSMIFPVDLVQAFPMPMECVQTDNGPNSLNESPKQGLTKTLLFLSVN